MTSETGGRPPETGVSTDQKSVAVAQRQNQHVKPPEAGRPTKAGRSAKGATAKSAALVPTGDVADGEVVVPALAEDAAAIRGLAEKRDQAVGALGSVMLEIANRLAAVKEREGWSDRRLAEWVKSEDLGFGSHVRVQQLLSWREMLMEQQDAIVATGPLPPEWALRPLVQAKTQGRLDEKQVATTFKEVTAGGSKAPTHSAVEKAVENAVQKAAKPKATSARKEVEPEPPPTFPSTSSARVLIEIDSGTPHVWCAPPTTFLAEWANTQHPDPTLIAELVANLRGWIDAIEEVIAVVENEG